MNITLKAIIREAEIMRSRIDSGELVDGCCMSAIQTPVRAAWDTAEEITGQGELSAEAQVKLLSMLDEESRSRLQATKFDDFDLIYEYYLQLIDNRTSSE